MRTIIVSVDQVEERILPRKINKLRDLRIVDAKSLIIKNLPIKAKKA